MGAAGGVGVGAAAAAAAAAAAGGSRWPAGSHQGERLWLPGDEIAVFGGSREN